MSKISKKAPFFIVGCPRSGTTLLQMLLDAHPDIAVPLESHIFYHFGVLIDHYGDLSKEANLRLCIQDLLSNYWIKRWNLKISVEDFMNQLNDYNFRGVITLLFEIYTQQVGKSHWGDKTPEHALCLWDIQRTFPEAKIIHLIRDGRDIAESFKRIFFGPKTPDRAASLWKKHVMAVHDYKQKGGKNPLLEIYYEDLVRSPKDEIMKVFNFIGMESSEILNYKLPDSEKMKFFVKAGGNIHRGLGEPISDKRIETYKQNLSQREIEIFELFAADALNDYGYETHLAGKPLSLIEKILLPLKDMFLRNIRKINHWSELRRSWQYRYRKWKRARYKPVL